VAHKLITWRTCHPITSNWMHALWTLEKHHHTGDRRIHQHSHPSLLATNGQRC
jgi:hypothetical protein